MQQQKEGGGIKELEGLNSLRGEQEIEELNKASIDSLLLMGDDGNGEARELLTGKRNLSKLKLSWGFCEGDAESGKHVFGMPQASS